MSDPNIKRTERLAHRPTFERDGRQKRVDWERIRQVTGRGAPEPEAVVEQTARVVAHNELLRAAQAAPAPSAPADDEAAQRRRQALRERAYLSPYRIRCSDCGGMSISVAEHDAQAAEIEAGEATGFACPICGEDAELDRSLDELVSERLDAFEW